ncbi:MAG TPA: acyltransferase [Candidatus Olsenella excrementigallinarum]|nr:acyltransferase [Candidatus Olsenella excrementigallinarum]
MDYQRDYARPTRSRRTRPATEQASAAAPALDERRQGAGRIGAIEGIRTLSIVAILLYHADPSWLPGGFFGVSVFFVLTGYLTTISLEREIERTGGVDYLRFVVRRLVRLVPSVIVAVGVTTVLCALFAHPLLPKLKSDVLSALLFFENIHYILSDVPYFAAAGLPSPLTHLWFLGVTMQFYLVWPLLLLLLRRVCPTRRALLVAVGALVLASAIEMAVLYDPSDTSRVYYGLDTRAAELLVGALCALATEGAGWQLARSSRDGRERFPLPGWCYEVAGVAALALLVVMTLAIDGFSPLTYYGGTLGAALLAAVLVGVVCRGGALARVLGAPPLVAAGAVSFSLYLWHYPLLLVMNPATRTTELPWWGWVLEFALIAVVSVASYVFVERGEGRPWILGQSRVRVALYAVTAVALLVLAVAPIEAAQTGVPVGQQAESSQETSAEVDDATDSDEEQEEEEKDEVVVPDPSDYTVDPETGVTDAKVLLVGDSVSLGAQERFNEIFPNGWMDSAISRQVSVGIDVYRACSVTGHDAPVVIFALGSNGPASESDVRALIDACGPERRVLLVNTRVPGAQQDYNNSLYAQMASEYDNVEVVDWYAASAGHDEYFWDDGTHLRPEGADAYVTMLRQAVTGR